MFPAIVPDAVDQSCEIYIMDSGDGTPETGVEHNTEGIELWYWRPGGVAVSISPAALAALNSAHSDGGIEHFKNGKYRLDLPDAAVAAGVPWVSISGAATGMIIIGPVIPLNLASAGDINTAVEGGDIGTIVAAIQAVTDVIPDAGALTDIIAAIAAIAAVTDVIPDAGALTALLADIASILDDTGTAGVILKAAGLNADAAEKIATQVSTQIGGILVNSTASGDLYFTMRDSTNHALATGKTVSGQVNIDGAGFGAVTGAITEVALGWYKLAANATDRNGKTLLFHLTAAGCDPNCFEIITGS